jgi:hypothetical protein
MSKRITRIGLGAAVAVAVSAVAGGAYASADSLPEQPTSEAISSMVIQINDDGTAIECTLTGMAAEMLVGDPSEFEGDAVWGVTEVSPTDEVPEVDAPFGEPIPGTEVVIGGEIPEGSKLGVTASAGTDPLVGGFASAEPAPIVSFDAAGVRPGTEEECAAIVEGVPTPPSDTATKD